MANVSVIKLKVRRGTDTQRKLVILDQGELGYTLDSKRLFVGDGLTTGGIPIGIKYYTGSITGAIAGDGNISTIQTGDIVFDTTANSIYILTGANTGFFQLSAYIRLK
jgi:hypothetical protein